MTANNSMETLIMRMGQRLVVLGLAAATLAMPRVLPAKEIAESSKLSVSLLQGGSDDSITGRAD